MFGGTINVWWELISSDQSTDLRSPVLNLPSSRHLRKQDGELLTRQATATPPEQRLGGGRAAINRGASPRAARCPRALACPSHPRPRSGPSAGRAEGGLPESGYCSAVTLRSHIAFGEKTSLFLRVTTHRGHVAESIAPSSARATALGASRFRFWSRFWVLSRMFALWPLFHRLHNSALGPRCHLCDRKSLGLPAIHVQITAVTDGTRQPNTAVRDEAGTTVTVACRAINRRAGGVMNRGSRRDQKIK